VSITLEESSRRVPDTLAEVLRSQAYMIAADGALYRDALASAATELGLKVAFHARGSESDGAARVLGVDDGELGTFLAEAGRALGPPWRKEHRNAAAAAIAALGDDERLRPPSA
jgi:hypothetical protein